MTTSRVEVTYTRDWQPQRLTIDGTSRGATFGVLVTFTEAAASFTLDQSGNRTTAVHKVSPRTLVLPTNIFSTYEVLAIRLSTAQVGARFPIYTTGENEMTVTLNTVTPRRMTSPEGTVDLRQCDVTFTQQGGTSPGEVWLDKDGYLARFVLPAQGIAAIRNDLTSVMMREERIKHVGDEQVFIPSTGFSLAGTWTKPAGATGRLPAVVLVGSGAQDRDETAAGIPIFGQLAGALADSGYAVVRYDRRGSGQSGGRTENATLTTYADDVVRIVEWLVARKDVDKNRIAIVGYGEGGPVAMLATSRAKAVGALALLGAHGSTGREVALEVQQQELIRAGASEGERTAKIALQNRVFDAMTTGKGWDMIPPEVRRASDTPWFRSFIVFDPAATLTKVPQPMLIVHGALDQQVLPAHADRLERTAAARKPSMRTTTKKAVIPGVSHLFVPLQVGDGGQTTLQSKAISPMLVSVLTAWLKDAIPPKK